MSKNKRLKKKREKNKNDKARKIETAVRKQAENIRDLDPESANQEKMKGIESDTKQALDGKEKEAVPDQPAEEKQQEPEKKAVWKKVIGIAGGITALVLAGVYIGGIVYYQDKFFTNTVINGIDASYSTVKEIESVIAKQLGEYEILLKERDGDKEKITADQIKYHYVSKGEVESFLEKQNPFLWPISFWKDYSYAFDSSTEFDSALLERRVGELKCFTAKVERAPEDAYMEFQDTAYGIVKEKKGKKVRKKKLIRVLKKAIGESAKAVDLEKEECYFKPEILSDDKALNQLADNLNAYAKTSITYQFGENQEVLNGSLIKDWLSYDEAGTVTLDEGQIPVYVEQLADKYDTYDKPRNFKTNDGSFVDVEGGRYGWKIDRETEAAELLELVKAGAKTNRTAVFAQTAVSWENSDLGKDYIEIDLTKQHLWMYVDGNVVVSSDFVSGDMSRGNRRTPAGTYTLYYKKSPSVLRSTTPGDSYETPVTYWMPFNGGVGLHDANWRGSFGGNIYQYNGSHGCINLPTSAAGEIYRQIYAGFPIICFYR